LFFKDLKRRFLPLKDFLSGHKICTFHRIEEKKMECYFCARTREEDSGNGDKGVVSFFIPELGISFRAQFKGNLYECQYASLLSLLEFIELNPQLFRNKQVEIYGDSYIVVNQVNLRLSCTANLKPYRDMALMYKKKFSFSLNWVPGKDNPAQSQ